MKWALVYVPLVLLSFSPDGNDLVGLSSFAPGALIGIGCVEICVDLLVFEAILHLDLELPNASVRPIEIRLGSALRRT